MNPPATVHSPPRRLAPVPPWPVRPGDSGSLPRVFRNHRPHVDATTCGQAAIATVLAHFGVRPFAGGAIGDGAAIDQVREAFGPDVPFGLGTSVFRIVAALRHYGLEADRVDSGLVGHGLTDAFDALRRHVARGIPVPVCTGEGAIGGRPWSAHWAVALRVEDAHILLGNASPTLLPLDRFLTAWRCPHLPWPHRHCAVLAEL